MNPKVRAKIAKFKQSMKARSNKQAQPHCPKCNAKMKLRKDLMKDYPNPTNLWRCPKCGYSYAEEL